VDVAAFYLDGSTRRDFMLCVIAGIRYGVNEIFILDVMQLRLVVTEHSNCQSTLRNIPEERRS